ncbi:DsrE family protein [Guyparkeria hydrothermalis]|uniref:DsrE family protein n=1 Tax=Guyparkeria TaxID=2035712 RepID=UPI0010AD7D87|nr:MULTISPECIES: DsrE family protein [Guyparkeria]MCL7751090.1 DsrE family protein [Guyparkeria hydrothermalis]TKA89960.1 hypothetical protein FAZ79_04625 [Guyparkeria sp. SB14A]
MKKMLTILALVIAAPLALQSNAVLAADTEKTKKVVYHVNKADMNTIKAGLRNVTNHINSPSGPETQIEIAVHGGGIAMLTEARMDPQLQAAIDNVKANGVEIKVCANTLRGKGLDVEEDLYDTQESDIVPSGVAHVADRQMEGWAYIHP